MDRFSTRSVSAAWRMLAAAGMLCAVAGCWREVEYTGPDPTVTARTSEPVANGTEELPSDVPAASPGTDSEPAAMVATEANGFANDLANSFAEPPANSATEQETNTTLPWEDDSSETPANETLASEPPPTEPPLEDEPPAVVDKYATTNSVESTPPTPGDTTVSDPESTSADIMALPGTSSEPPAADISTETTEPAVTADTAASVTNSSIPAETETPGDTTAADAAAASDAIESNPRLAAWRLGNKLSLAALANDRGLAPESVQSGLSYCKSLAATMGTSIADLPERGLAAGRPVSRQVLDYLFQQGRQVGRDLADRQGPDAAALFEVALKSNLLLVLYRPRSSSAEAIAEAITQAAPRAQLPANLWQPLVNMVTSQADAAEVRKAVKTFHAEVERHLAERAEQ